MSSTEKTPPCPRTGQEDETGAPTPTRDRRVSDMWRQQVRALCCACGALRLTTRVGASGEHFQHPNEGRCLVRRKCATCGEQTEHAFLRDGDPYADTAEDGQQQYAALQLIGEARERLAACEVEVRDFSTDVEPDQSALLMQSLVNGSFRLLLNPAAKPVDTLEALEAAFSELALGAPQRSWRTVTTWTERGTWRAYRYITVPW